MRKLKKSVWPHQVIIDNKHYGDESPDDWCKIHVGIRFKDWYGYVEKIDPYKKIFSFKDGPTALRFKIIWGYR